MMTKKFTNIILVLTIILGFNFFKSEYFGVEEAKAASTAVTITSTQDRKFFVAGDTKPIIVTINVKNTTSVVADHVRVDFPIASNMIIPESTISNGGQFLGDKIVWLLPDMAAGLELNLTFQYRLDVVSTSQKYYVATNGNDTNAGTLEAPLATINGARDKIRTDGGVGVIRKPIEVYIRGGSYYFDKPVVFGKYAAVPGKSSAGDDSGTSEYPITYKAYGDEKPIFVGGSKVTTPWTKVDGKPYWKTNIGADPSWQPNNLIVDGVQATLAKDPNSGFYIADSFIDPTNPTTVLLTQPTKLVNGKPVVASNCEYLKKAVDSASVPVNVNDTLSASTINLKNVRVHSYVKWSELSRPIIAIDPTTGIIQTNVASASGTAGADADISYCYNGGYSATGKVRYTLENVFEKLDNPGEWYFDSSIEHYGDLYYYPIAGKDPNTSTVEASKTTNILNFKPSPISSCESNDFCESNNTSYINIEGITFTGTQTGYIVSNGTTNGAMKGDGAVDLVNASHLKFIGNTFYGTGGYGVYALSYNPPDPVTHVTTIIHNDFNHILIQKNTFDRTGLDGVMLQSKPIIVPPSTIPKIVPTYNAVIDNEFTNFGTVVTSPAISIPNSSGLLVENNDIDGSVDGGGYAGIAGSDSSTDIGSVTLVPGVTFESHLPMTMISKNRITNVMQKLNDGGAIYVGHARNLPFLIDNNIISNVVATNFHYGGIVDSFVGIYLDEGQSNTSVTNNLVYNADIGLDTNMSGINNRVVNNIFAKIINTGFFSYYIMLSEYMGFDSSGNVNTTVKGQAPQNYSQKLLLKNNIVQFTNSVTDVTRFMMSSSMIRSSDFNLFFQNTPPTFTARNVLTQPPGLPLGSDDLAIYKWRKYYDANVAGELNVQPVEPHSKSADPLFVDPVDNNLKNFKLDPKSPAFPLGFKAIDLTKVGTDW
jgi:hypothetical protein